MQPHECSAVLVTRGGYDISEVLESLSGFREVIIWDNSQRQDRMVYGRYCAAREAAGEVIYTQDDDCLADAADVVAAYEPGAVVCNWPIPHREVNEPLYRGGFAPVGWGAVFDRSALDAFARYFDRGGAMDELFLRESDRVFTALNRTKAIWAPVKSLPRADVGMWREKRHLTDFAEIKRRIAGIR